MKGLRAFLYRVGDSIPFQKAKKTMIHWLIKDFKVTAKRVNFLHSQVLAGKKLKKIKKKKEIYQSSYAWFNLKNKKKIILMYFRVKNTLKSNHNHISKQTSIILIFLHYRGKQFPQKNFI